MVALDLLEPWRNHLKLTVELIIVLSQHCNNIIIMLCITVCKRTMISMVAEASMTLAMISEYQEVSSIYFCAGAYDHPSICANSTLHLLSTSSFQHMIRWSSRLSPIPSYLPFSPVNPDMDKGSPMMLLFTSFITR